MDEISFDDMVCKIAITCDCGHEFKISAIGVREVTDILCPVCNVVSHLDTATVEAIDRQWDDAMFEIEGDDLYNAIGDLRDAEAVAVAKIVDDGLSIPGYRDQ